jgi:alpha-tubulin suppressor-like RCC1 family protein/uncharacterized protein YjdB
MSGQPAAFTVVASGTPAPGYQWQRNGAAISGAIYATYSIAATTGADSGVAFTVVVSNTAGSVTSTAAVLIVTPVPVASVTIAPTPDTLFPGRSIQLAATAKDASGALLTGRAVAWTSSDTTFAVVSSAGLVTTRAVGVATVTATSEGKAGTATIVIQPVPVASVVITPATAGMLVGQTTQVTATTKDSIGGVLPGRSVTWSVGDTAVATVSAAGLVTARRPGTVAVTAASEGRSGSATVTVAPVPVAAVTVTPTTANLLVGQTVQLTAATKDSVGGVLAGRTLAWVSSDTARATVSTTGLVSARQSGTVTITASTEGKTATAALTIAPVPVASVTVTPSTANLLVGQTVQLTGTTKDSVGGVLPGRVVTWSSGDTTRASVSATGLVVARQPGQVTISASSEGKTATAALTIAPVPVAVVTVTPATADLLVGQTVQLTAATRDSLGVFLNGRVVVWTSSDTLFATVSPTGLVLSKRIGAVTITATSEGKSGSARITGGAPTLQILRQTIAAGTDHSCALTESGVAYCWGLNISGALGDGTTTARDRPGPVSGAKLFVSVATSRNGTTPNARGHSCGLTETGVAYCWGDNYFGQLGDGTTSNRSTPIAVSGTLHFAALSLGLEATCGVTTSGVAYCWGLNSGGQLGDGTRTDHATPMAVSGGLTFTSVSVGASQACGLTPYGAAYCWGNGSLAPVAVGGGITFATIDAGYDHSCGVATSGVAYCWGNNGFGQLGDGTVNSGGPKLVSGGLTFVSIRVGQVYSCGTVASGAAYCWGRNSNGELGDGTTIGRYAPTLVSGGLSFREIAVGRSHSCATTAAGVAYCWGANSFGELGDGTTTNSIAPVAVTGGFVFK